MTFKSGDKVTRINTSYGNVQVGQIVEVARVWHDLRAGDSISLKDDCTFTYDSSQFVLAKPVPPTKDVVVKKPSKPEKPVAALDPNGIDQHAPGAKLDAGKPRPELVLSGFANALASVVRVGTDGANKYTDNGWQEVPNGFNRYREAKARHDSKFQRGQTHDKESHSLHLAHVAWNALASLELYLKQNPEHKEPI